MRMDCIHAITSSAEAPQIRAFLPPSEIDVGFSDTVTLTVDDAIQQRYGGLMFRP